MTTVLLCRLVGPLEAFAVLRLTADTGQRVTLVLADNRTPTRVVTTAARPLLDRAEQIQLAGQLGIKDP